MDPYNEQRLKEEVIYLHTLWHLGPPNPTINPNPNPNPNPNNHCRPTSLRPTPSNFKKQSKNKRNKPIQHPPPSNPTPLSDIEWPCPPPPEPHPETYSAWPVLNIPPKKTRLPSAEEQARFNAQRLQRDALVLAKEMFGSSSDNDNDDDDSEDDDVMEEDECEEYRFLMRIFIQHSQFRAYYEKNYANGEFYCLVCGGIGEKIGKRYKDCVALVQHSNTIAKTKKKRAHRAYAQVICKVLGWDIRQLPTIVSSLTHQCTSKPGDSNENVCDGNKEDSNNNVDSVVTDNGGGVVTIVNLDLDSDSNVNGALKAADIPNVGDGELMICGNSPIAVVNDRETMQDLEQGVPNTEERNADGVVNHLCNNLSRTMLLEAVEMK